MSDEAQVPFWAKCAVCSHIWTACYTPMEMRKFAKVMGSTHCPKCGANAKKIKPAKQRDGKLLEGKP